MLCCTSDSAQEGNPIQFKYDKVQKDGAVTLSLKALIEPGVKLYSIQKNSEDAPYSSISFGQRCN